MFDLTGRVALVTGAASGIGAATARALADAGADVALGWKPSDGHDIRPVVSYALAAGRQVLDQELDVTNSASVDACAASTIDQLGRVDIVIANAGITRRVPALELSDREWDLVMNTDLSGAWRCFRAVLPAMMSARYGRLLVTSSATGTVEGWPEHVQYSAAKAGVVGMVRSLAVEVGSFGITVNAVAPGTIASPQALDPVNSIGEGGVAEAARTNPAGRGGTPEDVAALFAYLASYEAGFVNGQVIVIDGGASLGSAWTHVPEAFL